MRYLQNRLLRSLAAGLVALGVSGALSSIAAPFTAYSLKEAERQLGQAKKPGGADELANLGGITRLVGMVYEAEAKDMILVGERASQDRALMLDDLVVALRALIVHKQWPLVSIDETAETSASGKQAVRFEGGIANSAFGKAMLEADVCLKEMALGKRPAQIWGLKSYFDRLVETTKMEGAPSVGSVRFWYYPIDPNVTALDQVYVINELRIGVLAKFAGTEKDKPTTNALAETFATSLTTGFDDMALAFPEIARLRQLYSLTAVARGIQTLPNAPVDYWINRYKASATATPSDYPLLSREQSVEHSGNTVDLRLSGGVELSALVLRLRDGDATALYDAVIRARPGVNALAWPVALEGWSIPGYDKAVGGASPIAPNEVVSQEPAGCTFNQSIKLGAGQFVRPPATAFETLKPAQTSPTFNSAATLPQTRFADKVGGVMLSGKAKVERGMESDVNLAGGSFALVVDGQEARLDPKEFRRFITALWAVYFCPEDPGISIDPIAAGITNHLVRYIGNVVNSDLGRVMREADYLMKQWAVGTARPDFPGFRNPDEIAGRKGVAYIGVGSRFWFVPEDMTLRQAGGLLLFETNRMKVKTEFLFRDPAGPPGDPANEEFAGFLTKNYEGLAAKHGIFRELEDYAKLVALAKHLKSSGVPLFWFLMANKDLVLTEDSPGTVAALARDSEHFEGIRIEGGVELTSKPRYVMDAAALGALQTAAAQFRASASTPQSTAASEPILEPQPSSLKWGERSVSILPTTRLTTGRDRRGIRYQTDLALREDGQPGLELVRCFVGNQDTNTEFGNGWRLLIPYRVVFVDSPWVKDGDFRARKHMQVRNLINGNTELLTFDAKRYAVGGVPIAGWMPERLEASEVIGLFPMTDRTFRLEDKLGNRFLFDDAGYLTDFRLGDAKPCHVEYTSDLAEVLEKRDFRLELSEETRVFRGARIPRWLKWNDPATGKAETFVFTDERRIMGYAPTGTTNSLPFIGLMSDVSFRLADAGGNEFAFDEKGKIKEAVLAQSKKLVRMMEQGRHRVLFRYRVAGEGKPVIASAGLRTDDGLNKDMLTLRYDYDENGRLRQALAVR